MTKKTITQLEKTLQDNVRRLLDKQYDGVPSKLIKKYPNVVLSRLQDILKGNGCNVAKLVPLSDAFGLKPYQLLIPGLSLKHPQVVVTPRQMRALIALEKGGAEDEADGEGT